MNSVFTPIVITASDVPYMQQSTYTVGIYSHILSDYIDIYTGRCVGDASQKAVLRIDPILRDYAYRAGKVWDENIQEYIPDVLDGMDESLQIIENGNTFFASKARVRVFDKNGVERYYIDNIYCWAGWMAPWQKGVFPNYDGMTVDVALVANDIVPHLPPISTPRMWFGLNLMWFSNTHPVLSLGFANQTLNTTGEGCYAMTYTLEDLYAHLSAQNDIDGGRSIEVPDTDINGGDSDDIPTDEIDGGNSEEVEVVITGGDIMLKHGINAVKAATIDECASPYYVAWYLPSGGWFCWGFDGNVIYGGTPITTKITQLTGADKIINIETQPLATLFSGFVNRDEYNVLATLNYAREVYLYDTAIDKGTWCTVDNRGVATAGSQRWRNQPYELVLREIKHTNV